MKLVTKSLEISTCFIEDFNYDATAPGMCMILGSIDSMERGTVEWNSGME